MIKLGQFKIGKNLKLQQKKIDEYIVCNYCESVQERFSNVTDEVWADAVQVFMEGHKKSCKEPFVEKKKDT
jgi:endonuclease I